jgi:hypothetical protein
MYIIYIIYSTYSVINLAMIVTFIMSYCFALCWQCDVSVEISVVKAPVCRLLDRSGRASEQVWTLWTR